jgi:hypothetical protein
MQRLDPKKLTVSYLAGTMPSLLTVPRRYTLTHSDRTGRLFLSIGSEYDMAQVSGMYTRLMRDEVLAELCYEEGSPVFRLYCHVSGGIVIGPAGWRYRILQHEMPLVPEAIRYGDRTMFEHSPELDDASVLVHFRSTRAQFNRVENWGTMRQYR